MPYRVEIAPINGKPFAVSPFHENRWEVEKQVTPLLKTGDLLFRRGNESWAGIPFSKLVAKVTKSKWSHASPVIVRDNWKPRIVEVNADGTFEMRLLDWLDYCDSGEFAVYRVKDMTDVERLKLVEAIDEFLETDPDYNFTFDNPRQFYCTEAAAHIFDQAGVDICEPATMKELIPAHSYAIIVPINWFVRKFLGKGMPLDVPLYVVGNEQQGMLACPRLTEVLNCSAVRKAA